MVDNPLFLIVRPVPRNRVAGSQGMFRLRRWWKHFVCVWCRFALPAMNESSMRSTFSPILGIIQAILIVQSCFTNEKMKDIILRKVEAFTGFQESKESTDVCFFPLQKIDAQSIEEFYGLTSDISKNSESGYILFYQSRDWGNRDEERLSASFLLWLFGKGSSTDFSKKRELQGAQGGSSTLCTQ